MKTHSGWRPIHLIGAVTVAVLLGVFGMLADEVVEGDTAAFDQAVLDVLRTPGEPADPIGPVWFEEAVRDVTSIGSFSILGFITIVAVLDLLLRNRRGTAALLAVSVLGGTLVSTGLKALFDRPRPDLESAARVFTASFPSGHATLSAVVFLTIGVMLAEATEDRRRRVFYLAIAVFLTLMVGLSRIYMGVHYPTDVAAGWLIGTAWALLCWAGAKLLLPRRRDASSD